MEAKLFHLVGQCQAVPSSRELKSTVLAQGRGWAVARRTGVSARARPGASDTRVDRCSDGEKTVAQPG